MILVGAGCGAPQTSTSPNQKTFFMESITLTTKDEISIDADYYPADGDRFVILLHMMPAKKESWRDFATALQEKGISSIAIDMRGHGASQGGPNGYKEFSDHEQAAKIFDVRAAWEELKFRGAAPGKTAVIGASIGANLAIQYVDEIPEIPIGVALSPGLDYRSVTTQKAIANGLSKDQKVLIVASREDEYAFLSSEKLHEVNQNQVTLWPQENLGHGTAMFEKDRHLLSKVIDWIDERL